MDFKKKEIIGMIHLAGPDAVNKAMDEIKIYEEEGLSGIIVENYHGSILDVAEVLTRLEATPTTMSVGVNILPNEFVEAYMLADKFKAVEFIQLDYIAGSYKVGKGTIELDDEQYLELAEPRHNKVKVFGGVWPKYYTPADDSNLLNDLQHGMFLADAIVVTGEGTGVETSLDKIKLFRETMDSVDSIITKGSKVPLIIGAGLTPLNVREQLAFAQGAIVGSAFKPNGRTNQMVDRDLVRVFMDEVKKVK